jgi:2'-5' RNA ligase
MREPAFRRYFLALKPPRQALAEIAFWRESFLFGGRPVANERLHMTLFMLGDFDAVPHDRLARAEAALSAESLPACRIVLDTLTGGAGAALLAPSETLSGLRNLQSRLALCLGREGIGPAPGWRFSPHVTLLHDHGYAGHCPIDAISWTASELVLVESHIGQTRHVARAAWALGGGTGFSREAAPNRSASALVR